MQKALGSNASAPKGRRQLRLSHLRPSGQRLKASYYHSSKCKQVSYQAKLSLSNLTHSQLFLRLTGPEGSGAGELKGGHGYTRGDHLAQLAHGHPRVRATCLVIVSLQQVSEGCLQVLRSHLWAFIALVRLTNIFD